ERGKHQEAKSHFFDALGIAAATQTRPIALEALVGMAAVLASAGAMKQALELLLFVEQDPAAWARPRQRATRQIAELAAKIETEHVQAIRRRLGAVTLATIVQSLLSLR